MGPKDLYLIFYNVSLCAGWGVVLKLAVDTILAGSDLKESLAAVYNTPDLSIVLGYSQTAALLEIIHAGVGLVRSPVVVTAMQVMSRIVALVAISFSPNAQSKYFIHT
jgi:very-long-chain (3R)-3-hydroxyacyl-CoA dehydratase